MLQTRQLEIHQVKPQGPLGWNLECGTNCLECHFVFKRQQTCDIMAVHKTGWIILFHTLSYTWAKYILCIPEDSIVNCGDLVKISRLGWLCNGQLVSICRQEDFLSGFQLDWCCPFNAFRPQTTFPESCKGFWPTLLHVHYHGTIVCRRLENHTTQDIISRSYLAFDTLSSSL